MFDSLGDAGVSLTATGVLIFFTNLVLKNIFHNENIAKVLVIISIILAIAGISLAIAEEVIESKNRKGRKLKHDRDDKQTEQAE